MSHRATADSYLIWLGDMNFRLCAGRAAPGNAFSELSEPTLTFKPTYKLVPGRRGLYATSRRPAWTDRILYKVNADVYEETRLTMEPLSYQSHPEYTVSDHQPVSAEFRVKVFSGRPLPCVEFLPISMWLVGSDCVAKYRCDRALEISAWDWIALFRANFASLDEYISYIWAPRTTSSPNSDHYVAVFPEDSVTVPGSYVLVYFGRNGRGVYGISEPFAVQYSHTARLAALAI
ncbi:phosphatidylinositol 4,5-bisphosphate 5-phosphatase A-like, partial [Pollicipes pollicipes]|uniref:phosphatidylinositol 4,5-bisphosphate 5-phosphatase A-like n=1 Tax=Pollicipes pollicipes TaxID=41117 RepID=UPI0018859352